MNTPRFNLLPQQQRKRVARYMIVRSSRMSLLVLTVITGITTLLFAGGKSIFADTLDQQRVRTAEAERLALGTRQTTLTQEILSLNATLSPVQTLQTSFQKWSTFLPEIINLVPEGVSLTQFSISPPPRLVTIIGTATTRNDLLAFQSALQASSRLKNLSAPTTDLLQRENVEFTFTATLALP